MNGKEYQMIKTLYTAANAPEAHLIKGLLEQSGIGVSLAGESLTIGIGGLPIDAAQVEVKVNEDQFEEALKIIKDYENKMLGDVEESTQWECKNCSKMNPVSFGICWNCEIYNLIQFDFNSPSTPGSWNVVQYGWVYYHI